MMHFAVTQTGDEIVISDGSDRNVALPLTDRSVEQLQSFQEVAARALYEGYNEAARAGNYIPGMYFTGDNRLLSARLFFHPRGQILASETRKDYTFELTSRYQRVRLYKSLADFLRENHSSGVTVMPREEILSFVATALLPQPDLQEMEEQSTVR